MHCAQARNSPGGVCKALGQKQRLGKILREEEEMEATILEWWEMLLYLESLRQHVESDY